MKIAILGGGIAGLTTAIALNKIGFKPLIYEAADKIEAVGAGLALASNAIRGFQKLEIDKAVMAEGRLLDTFYIKSNKGEIISQTTALSSAEKSRTGSFIIHRADLHKVLRGFLSTEEIKTNKCGVDFERRGSKILLHFSDGSHELIDYLIAADGIHSPIRLKLLPKSLPRYAGYTCWRAVIDNPVPALKETSETWGSKGRFGIAPLINNRLYWFACINSAKKNARMKRYTVNDLKEHFQDYHHPIPEILDATKSEDLIWNDIIDLAPLKQYAFENILLIGDAAHATTPNLGQGACQAIEDAVVLADELKNNRSILESFMAFEERRMKKTHYIINQSRRAGSIAQLENKYIAGLRNTLMRCIPQSVQEKQLDKILSVDF